MGERNPWPTINEMKQFDANADYYAENKRLREMMDQQADVFHAESSMLRRDRHMIARLAQIGWGIALGQFLYWWLG